MQRLARHQLHRRADQENIIRRQVVAEVEAAARQVQLVQRVHAPHVGIGLDEAEELHAAVAHHLADHRAVGRVAHQEDDVDLVLGQRLCRVGEIGGVDHRAVAGRDAIELEQRQGEVVGAAA